MQILLKRIAKKDTYTIGKLYIDGEYFCDTLEDPVRQLDSIKDKIYSETAIPTGKYKVSMSIVSPKYSIRKSYNWCGGRLPRLLDVPFFEGILIHVMDGPKGAELSEGCIGIGRNLIKGGLLQGKEYYKKLYDILKNSKDKITIKIV